MTGPASRRPGPEYNDACFTVRDNNGQQLAYVYFENEPGRRWARVLVTPTVATKKAALVDLDPAGLDRVCSAECPANVAPRDGNEFSLGSPWGIGPATRSQSSIKC
jgi:hypothetical protein